MKHTVAGTFMSSEERVLKNATNEKSPAWIGWGTGEA
jgi:hypothetical protein